MYSYNVKYWWIKTPNEIIEWYKDFTQETIYQAWKDKISEDNAIITSCDNKNVINTRNIIDNNYSQISIFDKQTERIYKYTLNK